MISLSSPISCLTPFLYQLKFNLQFSSVAQSCPTLCDPMSRSMPGLPVHHQPPEFTQTHIYRVGDAIQPSHPLLSPSPSALNLFQHQGHFKWVSSLPNMLPKYWSFSFNISPSNEHPGLVSFRMDWLDLLAVQGTPRVFSNTTVQKHQFFGAQLCVYIYSLVLLTIFKNYLYRIICTFS